MERRVIVSSMPVINNNDDPRYVFICSAGHSGSTLLDLMLGAHSQIESLGEITHLPKNLALNTPCTCGVAVRECGFWKAVIADMSDQLNSPMLDNPYTLDLGFIDAHVVIDKAHQTAQYKLRQKALLGAYYLSLKYGIPAPLGVGRHLGRVVRNNRILFDAVQRCAGKRIVIDSSKSYLKALAYYKAFPGNTRIIALARDGRGVFFSGLRRGVDPKAALNAWLHHYARALPLYERHVSPDHLAFVRYEDLARDTAQTLKVLCEFLRLDFEEGMLEFADKVHHITNGNDMRFAGGEIRLDETWRKGLREEQLAYFETRAGRCNASLGYQ